MGRHSTAGTAPILSFPQAGSKDKKERGELVPKGESGKKKNREGDWARGALGGQQGGGRVFNTKFSKALHA
jgi:hypothetical protein